MNQSYKQIPYIEQLKLKQNHVLSVFSESHIKHPVNKIIKNDQEKHYRHKVTASATTVFMDKRPKLRLGMFIENTHDIDPGFSSFIHDDKINELLQTIEKVLNQYKISAYDIKKRQGIIKHVLIRKSFLNKDMLLVFVTHGNLFPNAKHIVNDIRKEHESLKTAIQMVQNKHTPIVLYGEEKIIYGLGYIEDGFDGLRFRLSAKSFYQVNPNQMIKLYEYAINQANISNHDIVMDCYSGIGTISLLAAKQAKEVIGVEINQSAVKDAMINAKQNHIQNVKFYNEDVEKYMEQYQGKIDVLILDPARVGATLKFLNAVKKLKPKRIVYISCYVETQVRDLKSLLHMYEIKDIQPVDMFSYTEHIENIVLLVLK